MIVWSEPFLEKSAASLFWDLRVLIRIFHVKKTEYLKSGCEVSVWVITSILLVAVRRVE